MGTTTTRYIDLQVFQNLDETRYTEYIVSGPSGRDLGTTHHELHQRREIPCGQNQRQTLVQQNDEHLTQLR